MLDSACWFAGRWSSSRTTCASRRDGPALRRGDVRPGVRHRDVLLLAGPAPGPARGVPGAQAGRPARHRRRDEQGSVATAVAAPAVLRPEFHRTLGPARAPDLLR